MQQNAIITIECNLNMINYFVYQTDTIENRVEYKKEQFLFLPLAGFQLAFICTMYLLRGKWHQILTEQH